MLIRWSMIPAYRAVTAHSQRQAGTKTSASHLFIFFLFYSILFSKMEEGTEETNLTLVFLNGRRNQEGRGNLSKSVNLEVKYM